MILEVRRLLNAFLGMIFNILLENKRLPVRGNKRPEQQEYFGTGARKKSQQQRLVILHELLFCVVEHQDTAGVLANLRFCINCIEMIMKFLFYDCRC